MEYADITCAGAPISVLSKLDQIVVEAMRAVTGAPARSNTSNCIPDAKRGYYGFIIVVVRALVRVLVRRDFLLATYSPHFFPDFFHIWQVA